MTDSTSPYEIKACGPNGIRTEVGVLIWSAAGWADKFRSEGYQVQIRQDGQLISYNELMRREDAALVEARRRFSHA